MELWPTNLLTQVTRAVLQYEYSLVPDYTYCVFVHHRSPMIYPIGSAHSDSGDIAKDVLNYLKLGIAQRP